MLLIGTRDGTVVNNYWPKLDKLNRERAAEVVRLREKEQHESYDKAVKPYERPKKEPPKKNKLSGSLKKPTLEEMYGKEVEELYVEKGLDYKQVAEAVGIKPKEARYIIQKMALKKTDY
jgi:ribosome-binding protein aMBF1 (putative translation factor)